MSISISISISIYLYLSISIYLPTYLPIYLSICIYLSIYIYLSICGTWFWFSVQTQTDPGGSSKYSCEGFQQETCCHIRFCSETTDMSPTGNLLITSFFCCIRNIFSPCISETTDMSPTRNLLVTSIFCDMSPTGDKLSHQILQWDNWYVSNWKLAYHIIFLLHPKHFFSMYQWDNWYVSN